jgi:hypothetical protein
MDPTPAALLAEAAAEYRAFESACAGDDRTFSPAAARAATRDMLRDRARELGFAGNEIEAAIDTALGQRVIG